MAAQEICNFQVAGSSPVSSTIRTADNRIQRLHIKEENDYDY